MVKFPYLVFEKAVGTNHNTVFCDMCDRWVHIYCNNISKKHTEIFKNIKKYKRSKSYIQKEIQSK